MGVVSYGELGVEILRSPREMAEMRKAGLLVWQAHQLAAAMVRPGVTPAEIDAADDTLVDYIGVGPVHATPTKPGRPAVGVELVADRATRRPFPRSARLIETVMANARTAGLLLYHGTGNADGTNGDSVLLGPPFVVTDEELVRIADGLGDAVERASAEASGTL